ncbi:HD domain-containing protein [Faecalicatena sp. AGMB00832]|uniref:HD domain-containing protein n=2 Tax=Faecalicatena faecalis TaxID=2726362 RepID=A0ABS6D8F3_9FIRM|nr:HD domain-containing protein [Faecalicatena faecalis]
MNERVVIKSEDIVGVIQRTLNEVDTRLVEHGIRVALLVSGMLKVDGGFTEKERQDICILSVLHDIGAYKTEEIDRLVQFETHDVWEHSIYGYLFLRYLSPLDEWAEGVLYHHVPYEKIPNTREEIKKTAQMINLADRLEIFSRSARSEMSSKQMWEAAEEYLRKRPKGQFSEEILQCFFDAQKQYAVFDRLKEENIDFHEVFPTVRLTKEERVKYLKMMTYAIDFRSQHTVTHTITTTNISEYCARYMGVPEDRIEYIRYGAMLHDLGKIGIPVEILEYPGKLSAQAMNIMRTHVDITEKILNGAAAEDVTRIALRHHEKIDGSGYPKGLTGKDMTLDEEIVAVSDIVSALIGTRSYKSAFSKERTVKIIEKMAEEGKLNPQIVSVMKEHFDEIIDKVADSCAPILQNYYGIQSEYRRLLVKFL